MITRGIVALAPEVQIIAMAGVRDFSGFTEENDPHGERDFGAFRIEGLDEQIFWTIDYYADAACEFGSEDPSDPARCYRVITIMWRGSIERFSAWLPEIEEAGPETLGTVLQAVHNLA